MRYRMTHKSHVKPVSRSALVMTRVCPGGTAVFDHAVIVLIYFSDSVPRGSLTEKHNMGLCLAEFIVITVSSYAGPREG